VEGYDDWLRQLDPIAPALEKKVAKQGNPGSQRDRLRTPTFKEIKGIEGLPALIESLEAERAGLYKILS